MRTRRPSSFVTDMKHCERAEHDPPLPLRADRIAEFMGGIVQVASLLFSDQVVPTALPCRQRMSRRRCMGRLLVQVVTVTKPGQPLPEEHIQWQCPGCGEEGLITNWWGTSWDISREREDLRDVAADVQRDEPPLH